MEETYLCSVTRSNSKILNNIDARVKFLSEFWILAKLGTIWIEVNTFWRSFVISSRTLVVFMGKKRTLCLGFKSKVKEIYSRISKRILSLSSSKISSCHVSHISYKKYIFYIYLLQIYKDSLIFIVTWSKKQHTIFQRIDMFSQVNRQLFNLSELPEFSINAKRNLSSEK